jgi:hypothetical protein
MNDGAHNHIRFVAVNMENPALEFEDFDRLVEQYRTRVLRKIMSTTDQLEKEEAQLERLLDTEPMDRNAVMTQIDRLIQARGEMERASSAMTLEMREYLTRAQWSQLPRNNPVFYIRQGGPVWYVPRGIAPGTTGTTPPTPATAPGARRGGRGQQ